MSKRLPALDLSDTDDESLDDLLARHRALTARLSRKKAKVARKTTSIQSIGFNLPLENAKIAQLDKVVDPANRRLQQLLWELNCDFELFPHQFEGVRAVAGVSAGFPESSALGLSQDSDVKSRLNVLVSAKPRVDGEDRGLILSDVMGLGKTVQAVSAIRLVNAMARAKGEAPKPSLVVSPNDAVLEQWKEHLVKAGMDPKKIVRLATKQKRSLPRDDIVLLCTRYDLMTEARFILDSYPTKESNDSDDDDDSVASSSNTSHRKSPLFPNSDTNLLQVLANLYRSESNSHTQSRFKEIEGGEKVNTDEVIVKYLRIEESRLASSNTDKIFQMLIIDEAVSGSLSAFVYPFLLCSYLWLFSFSTSSRISRRIGQWRPV